MPAWLDFARNGAFIAIIAHGLIGISLVWDKILLMNPSQKTPSHRPVSEGHVFSQAA